MKKTFFYLVLISGFFLCILSCNKEETIDLKEDVATEIETKKTACPRKDIYRGVPNLNTSEYISAIVDELNHVLDCSSGWNGGPKKKSYSVSSGAPSFCFANYYDEEHFYKLCTKNDITTCIDDDGSTSMFDLNPPVFTIAMQDEIIEQIYDWAHSNPHAPQLTLCHNGFIGILDIDVCLSDLCCFCGDGSIDWYCSNPSSTGVILHNKAITATVYYGCRTFQLQF